MEKSIQQIIDDVKKIPNLPEKEMRREMAVRLLESTNDDRYVDVINELTEISVKDTIAV